MRSGGPIVPVPRTAILRGAALIGAPPPGLAYRPAQVPGDGEPDSSAPPKTPKRLASLRQPAARPRCADQHSRDRSGWRSFGPDPERRSSRAQNSPVRYSTSSPVNRMRVLQGGELRRQLVQGQVALRRKLADPLSREPTNLERPGFANSQVAKDTISGHHPPSGDRANIIGNSVTGKDIKESTLGPVSAVKAHEALHKVGAPGQPPFLHDGIAIDRPRASLHRSLRREPLLRGEPPRRLARAPLVSVVLVRQARRQVDVTHAAPMRPDQGRNR